MEPTLDNLQRIAHSLAKRALKNGHDPNFYSPFARSAKRSLGINICGGKPDDVTVLLAVVKSTYMWNITEKFIKQCSLTLGQFDSQSVNLLVRLFHNQDACRQLISLSNNLKEKFENLLTTKRDHDERYNDTPLTRIELAIMIHFKEKYLSELIIDNDNNQLKSNIKFSIDDELNLAYCFLLAQIDDRLSKEKLNELKFLFNIRQSIDSLFDIYKNLNENFPKFFSLLIHCKFFAQKLVIVDQTIRNFQLFIQRYEDFIITFEKHYKSLLFNENNYTQTDAILDQNDPYKVSSFVTKFLSSNREPIKLPISSPVEQVQKVSISRPVIQQSVSPPPPSSSSNVPGKGLCVIINITAFSSSYDIETPKRAGSEKDVDLIKVIFKKLKFTTLECKFDFKKDDLDRALNHIDDQGTYGNFDCLVIFIMSHGLLHSFFTADSKEVIIRDIIKRYADSSTTTIWTGKSRLFFIQACRSEWPEHMQCTKREGVTMNDLSPKMIVAYSCSASEASKRSPTKGSSFIQVLCVMLLRYSHYLKIQNILDWTAKFVIKRDEVISEHQEKPVSLQQPEYIERNFSSNFRFSNNSLYDTFNSWDYETKLSLKIPLRIWTEIYDLILQNPINNN
ncbi:unnamed protein product [Rotaria sordida]|uniref:Caspase-8 n=1 Tax=Rotaria sordida TaxID=392033 RepID=A0A814RDC5_9BILA|nr:unnamed protein product [Rotaria sordida]